MKTWLAALAAVLAALLLAPALAEDYSVGDLSIDRPWARASAGLAKNGAAYMTISNHGEEVERLVAVATPVAGRAALHTHLMEGGVMKMRPVEGIEVHPGTPSVLKPGALHVMLMGLKTPLEEGRTFPLTLTFEKAGAIDVEVVVQGPGAMGPGPLQ